MNATANNFACKYTLYYRTNSYKTSANKKV